MQTQCSSEQLEFSCIERRRVVAAFDGGTVSSDAGALLLGRAEAALSENCRANHCLATCQKDPVTCSRDRPGSLGRRSYRRMAMMSALTCGLDAR